MIFTCDEVCGVAVDWDVKIQTIQPTFGVSLKCNINDIIMGPNIFYKHKYL